MGLRDTMWHMSSDMSKLQEMSRELDSIDHATDDWIFAIINIEKYTIFALNRERKSMTPQHTGIYAIYDAVQREGLEKWGDKKFLLAQWSLIFAVNIDASQIHDKLVEQTTSGMLIAIAGLLDGYFYFHFAPIASLCRINKNCSRAYYKYYNRSLKAVKEGRFPKINQEAAGTRGGELISKARPITANY